MICGSNCEREAVEPGLLLHSSGRCGPDIEVYLRTTGIAHQVRAQPL